MFMIIIIFLSFKQIYYWNNLDTASQMQRFCGAKFSFRPQSIFLGPDDGFVIFQVSG